MLTDRLSSPMMLAWLIYFSVMELLSLGPSQAPSCVLISEEARAENYSGNYACASMHEAIFRFFRYVWDHASHDNIIAFGTVMIALFTFVLYRSTEKLWIAGEKQIKVARDAADAAKRSADAAIETERGRVFVIMESDNIHDVLKGPRFYTNSPSMDDSILEIPIFRYRLKNYGKTPCVMTYRAHGMTLVPARQPVGSRQWQPQFGRGLEAWASGETTDVFECFPCSRPFASLTVDALLKGSSNWSHSGVWTTGTGLTSSESCIGRPGALTAAFASPPTTISPKRKASRPPCRRRE